MYLRVICTDFMMPLIKLYLKTNSKYVLLKYLMCIKLLLFYLFVLIIILIITINYLIF